MTINGARGFNNKISDRFDLTLECIRLHYQNLEHPLQAVFGTPINRFFFNLFVDFKGYVDFFLLQDLVDSSYERVNFFTELEEPFQSPPIPQTADEYLKYKQATVEFVRLRNLRISDWSRSSN